ncbi:MAG TPA: hypothetical protein VM818_18125 [Vicinamibacterales bacterium]|jgi:hypothetical protein|nr:hypothetical protein [Vicinamibacterales bacterium]
MELPHLALLQLFLQNVPEGTVVVKLMPPPGELERLRDVLIRSLGLSGTIALTGVVLGAIVGAAVFLLRYLRSA